MNYGDVALGVECALPIAGKPAKLDSRAHRLLTWLIRALVRSA